MTKTFDHITGDPQLKAGVEVTHWNGTPIQLAVEANAAREAGSNKAAQFAQGLQNMTLRSINMSLPPDEDWVDVTYKVNGSTHETRVPWRVFESAAEVTTPGTLPSLPTGVEVAAQPPGRHGSPHRADPAGEASTVRAGHPWTRRPRAPRKPVPVNPGVTAPLAAGPVPTNRPDELKARVVDTPSGTFGHLRIFTFHMQDQDIDAFINEVARLLSVLPPEGLVLDVRGNGGGYVIASEFLLQFLSPRRITPEPFQFVSTPGTTGLATTVADYQEWKASLEESVTTGSAYSSAFPLYPADLVNSVGQVYQGPVVLVTDAQCYSACDIFAAGFQDHEIGPVLGVEANTGAGGANVVTHEDLRTEWTSGALKQLPKGVQMRVALRRCLRVGSWMGQPVEDLGVVPDELHGLTKRDLLEENVDLMATAGALLAQRQPRLLSFTSTAAGTGKRKLTITTGFDCQRRRVRQRPTGRDDCDVRTAPPRSPSLPPPATSSGSRATTPLVRWSPRASRRYEGRRAHDRLRGAGYDARHGRVVGASARMRCKVMSTKCMSESNLRKRGTTLVTSHGQRSSYRVILGGLGLRTTCRTARRRSGERVECSSSR